MNHNCECLLKAVAEELLPYKELQLYFNKIMKQLLHLVFMFTAAANLVMMNYCANTMNSNAKATNSIANRTNSTAKATNSTANGTKSIAKVTNSIAKTCISITLYCTGLQLYF